jgi:heme exporter protein A
MTRTPEGRPPAEAALALHGIWKIYGTTAALRDVSISADPGRVLALLGPNGAGKSTALRIASGLVRPTRGTVGVAGQQPGRDGVRRLIGFAGHRTFLYGALTAEENLRFYADLYGVPAASVDAALERFALEAVRRRRADGLSRGLAQRLSLARALLHDPVLVLLDEPFTGLDAGAVDTLAAVITRLRGESRTVVLATHEWEAARQVADDAVVMVGGRVIHQGPAAALTRADLPVLYTGGRS